MPATNAESKQETRPRFTHSVIRGTRVISGLTVRHQDGPAAVAAAPTQSGERYQAAVSRYCHGVRRVPVQIGDDLVL